MKKLLVVLIIAGVLGGLGWQIAIRVREAQDQAGGPRMRGRGGQPAVSVELQPVRTDRISEIGRFSGSLSPRSQFVVAPKVSGRLEELKVDIGDEVRPGQLIAKLDDDEFALAVEQAKAELAVARARLAEARSSREVSIKELERGRELWERRVASDAEWEEVQARHEAAKARYDVALAEVSRRESQRDAAKVRLSYTEIRAAWPGGDQPRVVGERFVDEGEMLGANSAIVSILDNSTMRARIDVIERDYARLRPGLEAEIMTDAYPGETFRGQVVRIAPLLRETSRQARVEIDVPNPDNRLKPGMFVRAAIEFRRRDDATVVPFSALVRRDERRGVFLADTEEMVARFVPLELGITTSEYAEVVDPPISGKIVTLGHHLLSDGAAIRLPESRESADEGERGARRGEGRQ